MKPRFKTARAVAALVLGLGFFAGSAGLVVALIWAGAWLGELVMRYARGSALIFGGGLVLALMSVAGVVAWALFPRTPRFKAPGPELKRELHPALFKEIDRVAARCGVKGPRHVYLAPDVNAFVADVGGVLGLGTTRVLGLGLPLLHCLSLAELRSVLAHEFGHFAGGDTRIGHWVYRARAAVRDVVEGLEAASDVSESSELVALTLFFALVRWPFVRFGNFYLEFTLALSRAQELAADALAAQLEGVEVLTRSLQKLRAAAVGFEGYMQGEVVPLLQEGYLPPIGPGLSRFLESPTVSRQLERVGTAMDEEPEHALDSHPPLGVRVAHARALGLDPPRTSTGSGHCAGTKTSGPPNPARVIACMVALRLRAAVRRRPARHHRGRLRPAHRCAARLGRRGGHDGDGHRGRRDHHPGRRDHPGRHGHRTHGEVHARSALLPCPQDALARPSWTA